MTSPHEFEAAGGTVFDGQIVRFLCGLCRLEMDAEVHVMGSVWLARARVVEAAKAYAAIIRKAHGVNVPWQAWDDFDAAVAELERLEAEGKS